MVRKFINGFSRFFAFSIQIAIVFLCVLLASFILVAYFKGDGGFDIVELWESFYKAL